MMDSSGHGLRHGQNNPRFVDQAADELMRRGVGADRIAIVPEVVDGGTYGEVIRLRRYARKHGLQSILVVTSAYHSRRALWTMRHVFRRSGIEIGIAVPEPAWSHRCSGGSRPQDGELSQRSTSNS